VRVHAPRQQCCHRRRFVNADFEVAIRLIQHATNRSPQELRAAIGRNNGRDLRHEVRSLLKLRGRISSSEEKPFQQFNPRSDVTQSYFHESPEMLSRPGYTDACFILED